MTDFECKLELYLHDSIDKCLKIPSHEERAQKYAEILGVSPPKDVSPDYIASCMERSLLPKGVMQEFNEIHHPLSEGKMEVLINDRDKILETFQEAYKSLACQPFPDTKRKFFYLWRNLPALIHQYLKNTEIGRFLLLLPADTRVPDHSIWEHLKVTSALKAYQNLQDNSLFLLTIGPVQSFISQARKTQDLYMGSFLLSYLTFIGMRKIIDNWGPTHIIYPDLFAQPLMDFYLQKEMQICPLSSSVSRITLPTIPNRFVAFLPFSKEDEIRELAEEIKKEIQGEWKKIVKGVFAKHDITCCEKIEAQISDFPLIYWVAVPFKQEGKDIEVDSLGFFFGDTTGEISRWRKLQEFAQNKGEYPPNIGLLYELLYSALERAMVARKTLREFAQVEDSQEMGEQGIKCHLCGERNRIACGQKVRDPFDQCLLRIPTGKYMDEEEGLCAVCFTKRGLDKYLAEKFGEVFRNFSFPSTAEVATADFKRRALEEAREEFIAYCQVLKSKLGDKYQQILTRPLPLLERTFQKLDNPDGHWLFEENLSQRVIQRELGLSLSEEDISALKECLKRLTDRIGKPNPYYAILKLDGDNMGKWLSGELLPDIQYAYHSQVWQELPEEFKVELKERLRKIDGRTPKILTPAIHASISTALRNYALEFVVRIVEEEHMGKLVYAGGDDVLCLVNRTDLVEVMRKLRASFSGHIEISEEAIKVNWDNETGFVEKNGEFLLTMGKNATASAGAVIAHYKIPLKLALDRANEMLNDRAKEVEGRDAFAIALMKHSGGVKITSSKWRVDGLDVLKKMKEIGEFFVKRKEGVTIPKRFIYNLRREFQRLTREDGSLLVGSEIFEVELRRLLARAIEVEGEEEEKKAKLEEIWQSMSNLFHKMGSNIQNFANFLEISFFLGQEGGAWDVP